RYDGVSQYPGQLGFIFLAKYCKSIQLLCGCSAITVAALIRRAGDNNWSWRTVAWRPSKSAHAPSQSATKTIVLNTWVALARRPSLRRIVMAPGAHSASNDGGQRKALHGLWQPVCSLFQ
ncbi:unnamed protein product, partial [Arctia plantaginis]